MKKLFLLPLLFLFFSCLPPYHKYELEVTYFNGEKELIYARSRNGFGLSNGDLYGSTGVEISSVRSFKIIKRVKED